MTASGVDFASGSVWRAATSPRTVVTISVPLIVSQASWRRVSFVKIVVGALATLSVGLWVFIMDFEASWVSMTTGVVIIISISF